MKSRLLRICIQNSGVMIIALLTVLSCKRFPEPDFSYSPRDNPEAGDTIRFTNESSEANTYEWEFGDDGISTQENPMHIYEEAGIFDVKLTAFNEAGGEAKTEALTINEPTILGFFISDSTGEIALSGAEVWMYDNESDWDNIDVPLISGITDSEGVVVFTNVEPIVYYIWAFKEETDGMWVTGGYTPAINQNEVNLFHVPCDWLADVKKAALTKKFSEESIKGHLKKLVSF